jgi:tetraacyldisaccharide 4'-kinase
MVFRIIISAKKDILDIKIFKRSSLPLRRIMRLQGRIPSDQLLFTNKSQFQGDEQFRKTIMNYVGTSTRDGRLHQ